MNFKELYDIDSPKGVFHRVVGTYEITHSGAKYNYDSICFYGVPTHAIRLDLKLVGGEMYDEDFEFVKQCNIALGCEAIAISENKDRVTIDRHNLGDFGFQTACQMARNLFEARYVTRRTIALTKIGMNPLVAYFIANANGIGYSHHSWADANYRMYYACILRCLSLIKSSDTMDGWRCGRVANSGIEVYDTINFNSEIEVEKFNNVHLSQKKYASQFAKVERPKSKYLVPA